MCAVYYQLLSTSYGVYCFMCLGFNFWWFAKSVSYWRLNWYWDHFNSHLMEPSGFCRQRRRNSSISSLYSELPIDPDNDLRDPIISSGESTDDDCEEVLDFLNINFWINVGISNLFYMPLCPAKYECQHLSIARWWFSNDNLISRRLYTDR